MLKKILIAFVWITLQSKNLPAQQTEQTISQKSAALLTDADGKGIFSGSLEKTILPFFAERLAEQQKIPYDDHFLNDAAIQFLDNNKPDIAINLFKVNLELFPGSIFTYDILAQTYLKTGDKNQCTQILQKGIGIRPE